MLFTTFFETYMDQCGTSMETRFRRLSSRAPLIRVDTQGNGWWTVAYERC